MITLRRKPFIDTLSLCDTIGIDTKANMLEHCRLINLHIPKSWCKAEIADAMADFFKTAPLITLSHLLESEKAILIKLLKSASDAYVAYPRNDSQYLLLQDLHLVITYETPTEWYLFMPDCVREILKDWDLESHPFTDSQENNEDGDLVDVIAMYPKLSQVAFFLTLELVNLNIGNQMPYNDFAPYVDDLQCLQDHLMKGSPKKTLELYADLLLKDMRLLYDPIEKLAVKMQGKMPDDYSDKMLESALHSGTMLNAMLGILNRFQSIPAAELEKTILANKRKNGHLHFKKLETIAQEVTNEIMMDMIGMMCMMR